MKILLVMNKTLNRNGVDRIDIGYWNFYVPLLQLGHDVYFYDTVSPVEKDFQKVVESFKPDLIFACVTGNKNVTPFEPIEQIEQETKSGRTKTFNWFCDDTWRFENFSSVMCNNFNYCSTPEPSFIEEYKKIKYDNIILGNWHTNIDLYPKVDSKKYDIGFCGYINNQRASMMEFLSKSGEKVYNAYGSSYEDMLSFYSSCLIGINFSENENGNKVKTQMKLRMFEVPASKALLVTQNHKGLDSFFNTENEIVTFSSKEEMLSKIKFYLGNRNSLERVSKNGYSRVVKDHDSKVRLKKIIEQIK